MAGGEGRGNWPTLRGLGRCSGSHGSPVTVRELGRRVAETRLAPRRRTPRGYHGDHEAVMGRWGEAGRSDHTGPPVLTFHPRVRAECPRPGRPGCQRGIRVSPSPGAHLCQPRWVSAGWGKEEPSCSGLCPFLMVLGKTEASSPLLE